MLLLDELWDFKVGFLAVREANRYYQSSAQFAWKHSDRMYQDKGLGVFSKKEIG